MTTKSLSLTANSRFLDSSPVYVAIALTVLFSTLSSILLILATSPAAIAREEPQIMKNVPPPPPLSPQNQLIKNKYDPIVPVDTDPPTHSRNEQQREYTFSAPDRSNLKELENSVNQSYRVEVFGDTEGLLAEVRDIEPKAFQKGNIIQVGIFGDRNNAQDLVRKLTMQGLWSRIVVNN